MTEIISVEFSLSGFSSFCDLAFSSVNTAIRTSLDRLLRYPLQVALPLPRVITRSRPRITRIYLIASNSGARHCHHNVFVSIRFLSFAVFSVQLYRIPLFFLFCVHTRHTRSVAELDFAGTHPTANSCWVGISCSTHRSIRCFRSCSRFH